MKLQIRLLRSVALGLPLFALALAGCGSKDAAASTTSTSSTSAPPPSNLTPEQKQSYDAAVKGSQPPATKP